MLDRTIPVKFYVASYNEAKPEPFIVFEEVSMQEFYGWKKDAPAKFSDLRRDGDIHLCSNWYGAQIVNLEQLQALAVIIREMRYRTITIDLNFWR